MSRATASAVAATDDPADAKTPLAPPDPAASSSAGGTAAPPPIVTAKMRRAHGPWRWLIRSQTFVRKELVEIIRQPRLLALLVVGPFVLLLLFGTGYAQDSIRLRTLFVAPAGSVYEEMLDTSADQLDEFVDFQGLVNDRAAAVATLEDGDVDLVVVFPDDPLDQILGGERAVIEVLDREIDPIQRTAIGIAARLAVQELNATVLSTVAGSAQEQVEPAAAITTGLVTLAQQLDGRDPADPETAGLLGDASSRLAELDAVLAGSATIVQRLDPEGTATSGIGDVRTTVSDLRGQVQAADGFDSAAFLAEAQELSTMVEQVAALDPDVLVRPFTVDTTTVVDIDIDPTDYFTPAALALLLQHLALTFAALSLVRDRGTGLFELLRIGPLSSMQILFGKCLAYLLVGAAVAAALTASATFWLGVPFVGEVAWFAAMVAGVLLASLALGMVLSSISKTESQAVQFAMLTLLAGMFFSGFVLGLDNLSYPVKLISWTLPVTYGIRSFHTVMLLGDPPATEDIVGLVTLTVVYGSIATVALRRSLRAS